MTRKEKGNGHKTETPDVSYIRNVEVTHETSDVNVRAVATFVGVLTVATILVAIGTWLLFKFLNQPEPRDTRPGPMAMNPKERLPPEPRLQSAPGFELTLESGQKVNLEKSAPQTEYQMLRRQWEEKLTTIDPAIDKVLSEGLPTRVQGPPGKLQDYAISMPTAASSGRETEKRLQ